MSDKKTSLLDDLLREQTSGNNPEYKFVEIKRIPRKIDGKTLASLIVTASRIVPVSIDIDDKENSRGFMEHVALVEFKTEREAHIAVAKTRSTPYAKQWHFDITKDPKLADPITDMIASWIK